MLKLQIGGYSQSLAEKKRPNSQTSLEQWQAHSLVFQQLDGYYSRAYPNEHILQGKLLLLMIRGLE